MRLSALHAFAAVALVVPTSSALETLVAQPESRIWVEGTSSLKAFSCKAPEFTITVKAEGADAVPATLAGQKAVRTVELTVPSAKMDCANGTMNEHMQKALKADDNATIKFTLSGYDVAATSKGAAGTVRGALSLGGAEHPVNVTAAATDAGNGALRVVGSYELALSAFDLKAPTLMFGSIKVGDKVQVKFDIVLKN
ncbi:MAG: YceI family protein [bacterium]